MREAHAQVAAIASWLDGRGVKRGDRVAIAMRNYPEWMLIYWACACLGVAAVGMNAWWVPEEMEFGLKDAAPKVLFCDAERLARIAERPAMTSGITVVAIRAPAPDGGLAWEEVIETRGALPDAEVDPDDDASIFYTSGTTGFPKGAQLTHRGCVSNLFSIMFSGQVQALATSRATGVAIDPNAPVPVPVGLITTPLFHVTANNCGAYAITAGGRKDGADVPLGRQGSPDPDRARAGHLHERRAGDGAGTALPPRFRARTTSRASSPSPAAARSCRRTWSPRSTPRSPPPGRTPATA